MKSKHEIFETLLNHTALYRDALEEIAKSKQELDHKQVLIEKRDRDIRKLSQYIRRLDNYQSWMQNTTKLHVANDADVTGLQYKPLISIIMPTYNTDKNMLIECIESVIAQTYDNWELCIADDKSTNEDTLKVLKQYEDNKKITVVFRPENGHICAATNSALDIATGEYISLLDHDDLLEPNALAEVVKVLNSDRTLDFIYTDEDKIRDGYYRHDPFPKPDWSPDFLLACNYITHFSTIRRSLIKSIGGFRLGTEGAQDWDLFLRVTEKTNNIAHIPQYLYHWRLHEASTAGNVDAKDYITDNQKRVLQEALERRKIDAEIQESDIKFQWNIVRKSHSAPLISIVIPSKDKVDVLRSCITSIIDKSTYKTYEIIIVDTGSVEQETHAYYETLGQGHANIKVVSFVEEKFNYSRSCNRGAEEASGEYLVMLNNDTEVITPDWLEKLLAQAEREDVGAVGCRLYYPNKWIQHAGICLGLGAEHGGVAAHVFHTHEKYADDFVERYVEATREFMAVTAACLMVSKQKYMKVGGFDPLLRITFNDVDLCLKLTKNNWKSLYVSYVELFHHESLSVGKGSTRDSVELSEAAELMRTRWADEIMHDPFYNDNLSKRDGFYMFKSSDELIDEL